MSSGSVYADHSAPGQDESGPLLPPFEGSEATREEYGAAKVACEQLCAEAVGDRLLVARAGLIGGYGDRSDRFGYWPGRMALAARDGGPVLVPAEQDAPVQVVDVGDLARWLVDAGAGGLTGTFDAVGPRHTLAQALEAARTAAGYTGRLVPAPSRWLQQQGVEEFMGPRSLPLWLADPDWAGVLRPVRRGRLRSRGSATGRWPTWPPTACGGSASWGWTAGRQAGLTRRRGAGPAGGAAPCRCRVGARPGRPG